MQALVSRTFAFYKSYKATIIAYLFYLLFWWCSLSTQLRYKAAIDHINAGERLAWDEGVMYWYLLTFAVSIGATIVMLLNVALNKEARDFYFVMSIFTIMPLMIYLSIYDYKL
ncbi:MAG: hypothetical protein WC615_19570 [Mucilaginibacter sp.]|jgi:hypothetical protein|uniref:hypothetical protein n=1 Tax=Mucilaginibacter sp. TaxID=1882438 RepID=UPI003562B5F0